MVYDDFYINHFSFFIRQLIGLLHVPNEWALFEEKG